MNRELKKILRENGGDLTASKKDLKSIFDISFRRENQILCEGNDGYRIYRYTYGQMKKRIIEAASALYARIGATHSYVALEMENSPEWIVAFWAILMSGNKPYLVNTRYPHSLTEAILKTLNVRFTVCADKSELSPEAIAVSSLCGEHPAVPDEVFENELAFSSSATSMNEVICFYTGYQIAEQVLNFGSIVKENPRMTKHYKGQLKQLAFLPFYHVFGLFAVYFWFTFFGRALVFLRDYSADTILKTCRRHEVTHIFAVPMLWHTVEQRVLATVKEQNKQKKFESGIKAMTHLQNLCPTLGAAIAKRTMHEVCDKLFGQSVMFCINGGSYLRDSAMTLLNGIGYSMHNGYGMSEIGITSVELRRKPKYRNLNSIGHPFDSVEYRLSERGVLQVRGRSLCTHKLVNGEEIKVDGWFDTGDYMTCADGHYYILGRQGDVVIGENGENINPDTIEKLCRISGAEALSVLGIEGDNGQELSIVVQISPYATEAAVERIKNEIYAINNTLSRTTAIRRFYFTKEELMPPTAVKVSRKQLLKKIADGEIALIPFNELEIVSAAEETMSPLLTDVCGIIAKTLDIEPEKVTPTAHIFFDLGATSIQYFSILTALAEQFSLSDYDKSDNYRYTAKEICEYIERHL